jgi:chromosome segregation ATPase
VLDQLEGQVAGLRDSMGGFRDSAAGFVDETQRKVADAQAQSVEGIARASTEAAAALKSGLAEAMADIRREVETFGSALRASQTSLGAQAQAIDAAAARSRDAADALGQSAQAIRAAVDPVTRSNEKLAGATQTMTEALGRSVASLDESQRAAVALARSIAAQSDRVTETWHEYEKRFGKVDDDLGRAFEKLTTETHKQAELLRDHTVEVEKGLAASVDKLATFLQGLDESAEGLQEAADDLKTTLVSGTKHLEHVS